MATSARTTFLRRRRRRLKPDWVDTNKIGIPQADEQQRLLANLIVTMNRDRTPLPRFWYLPRDEKAALVMTGDDHATGGTAGRFNTSSRTARLAARCANWDCVRSTSYIYANSPLTNAQASVVCRARDSRSRSISTHRRLVHRPGRRRARLALLHAAAERVRSEVHVVPAPVTEPTHCVEWSDWATQPKVELAHGIRLDTNYYHYPASWIGDKPGYMTGSGDDHALRRSRRLADRRLPGAHAHDGRVEHGPPSTVNFLLDRAIGPEGYYGMFVSLNHTDIAADPVSDAIIASAQARSVPVISAKQALAWVDGRDSSTIRGLSWIPGRSRSRRPSPWRQRPPGDAAGAPALRAPSGR